MCELFKSLQHRYRSDTKRLSPLFNIAFSSLACPSSAFPERWLPNIPTWPYRTTLSLFEL